MKRRTKMLCMVPFLIACQVGAVGVNTGIISTESLSTACFNWRIIGGCIWLKYTLFSVSVHSSVKVAHSLPDVVISVYDRKYDNPWSEMSLTDTISDSMVTALFGENFLGGAVTARSGKYDGAKRIQFKFATAIGNPLASSFGIPGMDYFTCESGATSFMPYFNSISDNWLWRMPAIELLTNPIDVYVPGVNVVGERVEGEQFLLRSTWGKLYPRNGFVGHLDDYRSSAVVASRVASIITNPDAIHVATSINGTPKSGYWPPIKAEIWDSKSGKYQMLYPVPEPTCHLFGNIPSIPPNDPYVIKRSPAGGGYAWNFWREYKCCKKEGQVLLSHFGE